MRRLGRGSPSRSGPPGAALQERPSRSGPPGAEWPWGCRARCRASGQGRPVGLQHRPGHGPCWSRRPSRSRPPPAKPPFCGLGGAVRLHVRAGEREFLGHGAGCRHALEHPLPDAASRPAGEAVVDRGGRAIGAGHVPPPAARLQHVQDARDHPPVVHPGLAGEPPRQVRLDGRPSLVRKPEQMRRDPAPCAETQSGRRTAQKVSELYGSPTYVDGPGEQGHE